MGLFTRTSAMQPTQDSQRLPSQDSSVVTAPIVPPPKRKRFEGYLWRKVVETPHSKQSLKNHKEKRESKIPLAPNSSSSARATSSDNVVTREKALHKNKDKLPDTALVTGTPTSPTAQLDTTSHTPTAAETKKRADKLHKEARHSARRNRIICNGKMRAQADAKKTEAVLLEAQANNLRVAERLEAEARAYREKGAA